MNKLVYIEQVTNGFYVHVYEMDNGDDINSSVLSNIDAVLQFVRKVFSVDS